MAENITAKIQVRRGELEDLPILAEGELGYALDGYRLFIGNAPIEFTGDGVTTEFTIQDRTIISSHINVLVNGSQVYPNIEYVLEGTRIVFALPPEEGYPILVNFNTEITTQKQLQETLVIPLDTRVTTPRDLGINFNLANYNTAIIDYSLSARDSVYPHNILSLRVGTLKIITDGERTNIDDSTIGIDYMNTVFNAKVESGRLHITYVNDTDNLVNFYYSVKLWNTI